LLLSMPPHADKGLFFVATGIVGFGGCVPLLVLIASVRPLGKGWASKHAHRSVPAIGFGLLAPISGW